MLFGLFFSEKNHSPLKGVDAHGYSFIGYDFLPGGHHLPAPVDVIKNENCVVMHVLQEGIEIFQCSLAIVIPQGGENLTRRRALGLCGPARPARGEVGRTGRDRGDHHRARRGDQFRSHCVTASMRAHPRGRA